MGSEFLYAQQLVFRIANAANDARRLEALFIQIHFLQNLLDEIFSIGSIINSKIIAILPQLIDIAAQHPCTKGMEGKKPHILGRRTSHFIHTLAHFCCCLIGKGDGQNAVGTHALLQQMRHAAGQNLGLTTARTRQNQHGSVNGAHGLRLLLIQALQCIYHNQSKPPSISPPVVLKQLKLAVLP